MAIQRACKNDLRNQAWGRHLRRTTAELFHTSWFGWNRTPDLLASAKIEREQSPAERRILKIKIREGKVGLALVCCPAPFDSAQRATMADAALPEELAATLGIHRANDS